MLVGSRLLNGEYALFDIATDDYKVARNEAMHELACIDQLDINTPFLALITKGCGRDLKPRIVAHRVDATPQEPA